MARYDGTSGNDTYTGTDAADTIMGYAGDDVLSGGKGDDTIDGGDGDDTLSGGDGKDVLTAGAGRNTLDGGAGTDKLFSSGGIDTIIGGEDIDTWTFDVTASTAALTYDERSGTISNGTTFSGVEFVTVKGGYGDDVFLLNDTIRTIVAGGGGTDTVSMDLLLGTKKSTFTNSLLLTSTAVSGRLGASSSEVSGVETLLLHGTRYAENYSVDLLTRDPGPATVEIDAGGGKDAITFSLNGGALVTDEDGVIHFADSRFSGFDRMIVALRGVDNHVVTGSGNDAVLLGPKPGYVGSNTIDLGAGDDTAKLSRGIFVVEGGAGHDRLVLTIDKKVTFNDMDGTFSNGSRETGFESVNLTFRGSASTLQLASGADLSIETAGNDMIVIDRGATTEGVNYYLSGSSIHFGDTYVSTLSSSYEFSSISFAAGSGNDVVSAYGLSLFQSLDAGAGYDQLSLYFARQSIDFRLNDDGAVVLGGVVSTVIRNFEEYSIRVDVGRNSIITGAGNDIISAYDAGNTLGGGEGNDIISVSYYSALDGNNTLDGGAGADKLTGAYTDDTLIGGSGADILVGNSGSDTLLGGDDNDLLQGGGEDDTLEGGAGDDIIDGGAGIDTASYAEATAGVEVSLALTGQQNTRGAGQDLLTGVENLLGSAFDDVLTGDANANQITGGGGADRLTGGGGADVFVEGRFAFSETGRDIILDFSHAQGDRIDVSPIDADGTRSGNQVFTFIGGAAFSGAAGELHAVAATTGGFLVQGDTNGDGRADFTFVVKTDVPLVAADFVL